MEGTFATAAGGSVEIRADGTFTYTPAANYHGTDSFDYTVTDGVLTDAATASIAAAPVNDAPVAVDDAYELMQNGAIAGNVLDGTGGGADTDADGDALSVVAADIVTANGGSVMLLSDGSFTYAPLHGFADADSFEYTVSDGNGGSDTGSVSLNVKPLPNAAPVAVDDSFDGVQDTSVTGNVLSANGGGADHDPDGDTLSVAPGTFATAQGGTVVIGADGAFVYTPKAGFTGADSFDYTISDGRGGTDTGTAAFAISPPPNRDPHAADDAFTGTQNVAIEGNLIRDNGHGADTDADGDALRVGQTIIASAAGGSVIIMANGDFTYMPKAGFTGVDSFEYTLSDGRGGTDTATVSLTINPAPNAPPVAQDDSFAGTLEHTITGNVLNDNGHGRDTDPNGDALSIRPAAIVTANGGMVSINADGDFVYTGATHFTGRDSFTYTLQDSHGAVATATVTLDVAVPHGALAGTSGSDTINGGKGNDILMGLGGDDKMNGGNGNDHIYGGTGNDQLNGNAGNDIVVGGAGKDALYGNDGNDILIGGDVALYQHAFNADGHLFPTLKSATAIGKLGAAAVDALGVAQGDLAHDGSTAMTVGFVGTTASYHNTLGYYEVGADGTIMNVDIVFKDTRALSSGASADIDLPAGAQVSDYRFFIIADGFSANGGYAKADVDTGTLGLYYHYGKADQRAATVFDKGADLTLVHDDGHGHQTVLNGPLFHTVERGDSLAINADGQEHAVSGLLSADDHSTLRIGFEDLTGGGDRDYDDVVFDVSFKPVIAGMAGSGDGDDVLYGNNGNDILIGGAGNDTLFGGDGRDVFKYLAGDNGTDVIKDFKPQQDAIDISDVLHDEYDPVMDMLSQFVKVEQQGKSTVISVDAHGGGHFTALAIIENVKGLDLDGMLASGNLITH